MQTIKVLSSTENLPKAKMSQYEFESRVYDTLKFGDESEIAKTLGNSPGLISQKLNPCDDRKSDLYRAYELIWAQMQNDECRGLEMLAVLVEAAESHKRESDDMCRRSEAARFIAETSEAVTAQIIESDPNEQISELKDVIAQAERLIKAIRCNTNREAKDVIRQEIFS